MILRVLGIIIAFLVILSAALVVIARVTSDKDEE